jgi:hypothetical protein
MLTKPHLHVVFAKTQNRSVAPKRSANADLRTREYLTPAEIDKLIAAAKTSRYPQRDDGTFTFVDFVELFVWQGCIDGVGSF